MVSLVQRTSSFLTIGSIVVLVGFLQISILLPFAVSQYVEFPLFAFKVQKRNWKQL